MEHEVECHESPIRSVLVVVFVLEERAEHEENEKSFQKVAAPYPVMENSSWNPIHKEGRKPKVKSLEDSSGH
jgi:hypothetical protein